MQAGNTTESWGWVTRLIHWLVAILILFQIGFGKYMTGVEDLLAQFALTQTHKSWGFIVFALAVLRVAWRLSNRTSPDKPADMPTWQWMIAEVVHKILYLLMFILPISGWVMSAASPNQDLLGIENKVFDWFALPDPWVPGVESIADRAESIHHLGSNILIVILLAHAGAALKHHFVEKDNVLSRMTFGR